MRAYVALGSNLGDRGGFLTRAIEAMRALPETAVLRESSRHETDALLPEGDSTPQPTYLNSVVELETTLSAHALFAALKRIERGLGRTPAPRWAPRVIDLDLLIHGDAVVDTQELVVPHPRLHERRFVLEPLSELAPELKHPRLQRTVRELLLALC